MHSANCSRISGHFLFLNIFSRLTQTFWKINTNDVREYWTGCVICQQHKDGRSKPYVDHHTIPLPNRRWGSISTDFITHLPVAAQGFNFNYHNCLSVLPWVHFLASSDSVSAVDAANAFFKEISRLHGLPDSIISNRDSKFTSAFLKHLMSCCEIKLRILTSHHPQTDTSSEIMNKMLEHYLRLYCFLNHDNWYLFYPRRSSPSTQLD